MGNEASTPIDDSVSPTTLKSRTLESVANYIREKDARKIVVLVSGHKVEEEGRDADLVRPVQALARLLEFQTSDHLKQVYIQILPIWTYRTQKQYLASPSFEKTQFLSTP